MTELQRKLSRQLFLNGETKTESSPALADNQDRNGSNSSNVSELKLKLGLIIEGALMGNNLSPNNINKPPAPPKDGNSKMPPAPPKDANSNAGPMSEKVTSEPMSLLATECKCVLCFDSFSKAKGFSCAGTNKRTCSFFTCWECMLSSYEMASRPGAIKGGSDLEGELLCTDVKCRCPVQVEHLARAGAPKAVLEAREAFKIEVIVERKTADAVDAETKRMQAEYARIEAIKDEDEKVAHRLRMKIVDNILTLRCPRCKAPFMDFEGCFALTCGSGNCQCGFCAWCLADCGADAHAHVLQCAENQGGGYFNPAVAFDEHHRKKRAAVTKKVIKDAALNTAALAKLREMLRADLTDLKIPLDEVFREEVGQQQPSDVEYPEYGDYDFEDDSLSD